MRHISAIALALALVIPLSVPAPLAAWRSTLDQAAQSPGEEMDRFQWSMFSASYTGMAQTLTVGQTGVIEAVELFLSREAFTTHDLAIEIRGLAPGQAVGDGVIVAISAPVPAERIPIYPNGDWIRFNFPVPRHFTAGQPIAIVAPFADPYWEDYDPAWFWAWSHEDYGPGVKWGGYFVNRDTEPAQAWDPWFDGSDLAFRTYVGKTMFTGFTGVWKGTDPVDGSELTISIGRGDAPQVLFVDSFAPNCADADLPTRFAGVGKGEYDDIFLWVTLTQTWCGTTRYGEVTGIQMHWDPGSDTLWGADVGPWYRAY